MESSGICVGAGMRLSNVEHINIHTNRKEYSNRSSNHTDSQ